jgi:hypothetical protein
MNYRMELPKEFEVSTAVTMKTVVFWDAAPCGSIINRHFGGTCSLHLQGIRKRTARESVRRLLTYCVTFTLKTEATRYIETSVSNKPTLRHIPEVGILRDYQSFR